MALLSLRQVTLSHGALPLVENANLTIRSKEKVCLIGRNGVGKSTLLKLIHGDIQPDEGMIEHSPNLKIAFLPQEVPENITGRVATIVAEALENKNEWENQHKISAILSKLELNGEMDFENLSGGLKRRVLLAKALITEPELLLLDEPTNHLDIDSIAWLEKFLSNYHHTLMMVTHDRVLMQKIATHIVEIDNGQLHSYRCHYDEFLKQKETVLSTQEKAESLFDKKLAQEEIWIRQGIKARRTRNEGRVRALKKMREQRSKRRVRPGQITLTQQTTELSGKIVFEVDNISFAYRDKNIIKNFSTVIMRGDKIGIIGPNGAGKSTLLNLLLGTLKPTQGTINQGTQLNIAYFDQQRLQLDSNKTVLDNVCGGSTFITIGQQSKHCMSYLQDYLFSPGQARALVKTLSGGERNRAMLAKLFTQPSNVLVLDEPTNDLDIETLELLEEQLINYSGTLLLISHDRAFLNNVVTSTIVMEGDGTVEEFVGGYDDWLRQRKDKPVHQPQKTVTVKEKLASAKLTYNETRELQTLPKQIDELEKQQQSLQTQLSDPNFYKNNSDQIPTINQSLKQIDQELEQKYLRWQQLESKK